MDPKNESRCPKCRETKYDPDLGCKNCGYDWEDDLERHREAIENYGKEEGLTTFEMQTRFAEDYMKGGPKNPGSSSKPSDEE